MNNCHDCGAQPGTAHDENCDVARCLLTGQQRLVCQAMADEGLDVPGPTGEMVHIPASHPGEDCRGDVWTGEWPGTAECREYGLWVYCPPTGSPVPCGPDHPDAVADVTALMRNGRWDREAQRWVLLDSPVR